MMFYILREIWGKSAIVIPAYGLLELANKSNPVWKSFYLPLVFTIDS